MTLSEILATSANSPRTNRYLSQVIGSVWIPGGAASQVIVEREIPAAMLLEAELFIDRAIVLFLIRQVLRSKHASTWADVAVYYSNYFSACSFSRLNLASLTHIQTDVFEVKPLAPTYFQFQLSRRGASASHKKTWDIYYHAVTSLAWPDTATVEVMAPTAQNRHRERRAREAINYTPGKGFLEIHESAARYAQRWAHLERFDLTRPQFDDSTFLETSAFRRLDHTLQLITEVQRSYLTSGEIQQRRQQRRQLVSRYAMNHHERQLLLNCLQAA